jgi:hypothetical protein
MVVVMILWVLFTGLYMWVQPYMKRSRDTKRVSALLQYTNILEAYEKNFERFPSNSGSGNSAINLWYCLTELGTRSFNHPTDKSMKFGALNNADTSRPPSDPGWVTPISPCTMTGSYFYSNLVSGPTEVIVLATRLEIPSSTNYSTGSDLTNPSRIQSLINAKKGSVDIANAPDPVYVITRIR